ncbi:hypothetical protein ACYSNR_09070 [Enterococcus sp. LJL128]|uniref:hypothetical protein n=1 Tax=Enterococcus sp. LJL51 TaxID=3416656 RepID=UPI003CE69E2F
MICRYRSNGNYEAFARPKKPEGNGKKLKDIPVPWLVKIWGKKGLEKAQGTMIIELLEEAGLI